MSADPLSLAFSALADPTRRGILARLALGETSVSELAEPYAMSLPAISKHLKVLERAGLITRSRDAQWRPCRLQAGPMQEIDAWIEHYRHFWDARFDRLDAYLRKAQAGESKSAAGASIIRQARGAGRSRVQTASKEKRRASKKAIRRSR